MAENSRRSAHATIRGYLYQTCLGVLRWLELQPNEVLVCEGDEDLDRYLLNGEVVFEQVKDYSGGLSLSDRAVLESLGNFLQTYVVLHRQGEDRKFVFTTTAYQKAQRKTGLNFDLLEEWKKENRTKKVVDAVRSLLKPRKGDKRQKEINEARSWLDGQQNGWKDFMDSVEWTFGAPDLATLRRDIRKRIAEREDTSLFPPDTFLERLVVHILETSCRKRREERQVTARSLADLIDASRSDLRSWARSEKTERLRIIFEEADPIESILYENTSKLPRNATPGKLLTAAYEIIPFDEAGRSEELAFLKTWCDNGDPKSVLLLTGEGGSGKTRLMIEWCRRLRHRGWHAGFLLPDPEEGPRDTSPLLAGFIPRLIVVDYAETRLEEVKPILRRMGGTREGEKPKVRLVLLARREGEWWTQLSSLSREVSDLLLDSEEPKSITPLVANDPGKRREAFDRVLWGFAQELGCAVPKALHIPDLAAKDFDRALYLHMAALATVQGDRIETAADALRLTLEHERLFWHRQVEDLRLDGTLEPLMLKALEPSVAAVTLTGGANSYEQALSLLSRALKSLPLQDHHLGSLVDLLRNLYAGWGGEAGRYIDPLQPDLLGEELVAETLTRDPGLLGRILEQCSPREAYLILVVLSRLVRRISKAEEWIGILAGELEGKGTQEVWATLHQLCNEKEFQRSVPLREIAYSATAERLKLFRDRFDELSETEQWKYARLLSNHGVRLGDLGRWEDALKFTEEAVAIYRPLVQERPDEFLPDLATSLVNLGSMFSDLGHREDALKVTEEAVNIYLQLAETRPDAFLPDLATSLHNLGNMLRNLGRREHALTTTEKAINIRRELAKQRSDAFLPDLAASLNNLGNILSDIGRQEEALKVTEEAVAIRRELVQKRPDVFLPELATSLSNLGSTLSDLGRLEDALQTTKMAAEIRRRLAQQRPDSFLPAYAMSLNNVGAMLSKIGHWEEGLEVTNESVDIYRQLAQQRPDAFLPGLAMNLNNLGAILGNLGRLGDAFLVIKEAVEIRRHLARSRPSVFLPTLASSLATMGMVLRALDQSEDARKATEEALRILTPFFLQFPTAFASHMAIMVKNYCDYAKAAGHEPDQTLLTPILEALQSLPPTPPPEDQP